ncbi:MAG: undecaprenyldiphospho-muramoylpentapeptide beta-N-acetylglucosaminyltransferase [Alistipes sp.]|nr:undecaprenyldiphospho-muramoylpentapeptide beta-N-acetylglucosaminyltransferase [Alistipes sp.]MBQ3212330.1 undecaprenyldiphospho-muramoylpentapeptide beta-N-acetylglucosaminyltransferase [Alistipes sp.]
MKRVILSGGGTGGHIYPAVAVAEALKNKYRDNVEILFVGAEGKMEMEKVPALGYNIVGLPIAGLQRRLEPKNLLVPFKLVGSVWKARSIIKDFAADAVVGFGGYASAPVLWAAQMLGVPTIIQEQNSYAGLTNKMLSRRARRICVAYENMERFFPSDKIILTGNPLRGRFAPAKQKSEEALAYYGFSAEKPTLLVVGGSLGTRTLNEMMKSWILSLEGKDAPIQVIWQTGKYYEKEMQAFLAEHPTKNIWQGAFIERMDLAYEVADLAVSRSGACTVSELCLIGKPTIFVPSPNVAEDHQTKNAMALVERDAARMVADKEAVEKCMPLAMELLQDESTLKRLSHNISVLGIRDAAERVMKQIEKEW